MKSDIHLRKHIHYSFNYNNNNDFLMLKKKNYIFYCHKIVNYETLILP
jgi:hypothetical protein